MKTLIRLPFKLITLPVVIVLGIAILLAKIATELSFWFFGPALFLGAVLTVCCAVEYGLMGFLLMGAATISCIILPLAACLIIDMVSAVNGRLLGFLRS